MKTVKGQTPKYQIWAEGIRKKISTGELKPGERLPSFSQMKQSGFSQATQDRALAMLESEGSPMRAGFGMPAEAGAVCADVIAAVCAPEAWNGRRKGGSPHERSELAGSGMSECVTASRGRGPL